MKGPGLRIENDVRRVWKCPRCGRRDQAEGAVTLVRCRCTDDGIPMRLVEGLRQVRRFEIRPSPPPPTELAVSSPATAEQASPQPAAPSNETASPRDAAELQGETQPVAALVGNSSEPPASPAESLPPIDNPL